jgi:hypothetical protein
MDLVFALAPLLLPFGIFILVTALLLALALGAGAAGFFALLFAAFAAVVRKVRGLWT